MVCINVVSEILWSSSDRSHLRYGLNDVVCLRLQATGQRSEVTKAGIGDDQATDEVGGCDGQLQRPSIREVGGCSRGTNFDCACVCVVGGVKSSWYSPPD